MLALDGHAIDMVESGVAALGALERVKFDLVIIDYNMPGMNGDQLASRIKALIPTQTILMFTAQPQVLTSPGNAVSVDLVLSKPCDIQQFRAAVEKLLKTGGESLGNPLD